MKMDEKCSFEDEVKTPESHIERQVESPPTPYYKNELSIFQKETLQKIEEFRAARSKWATSYTNQTISANINEYKTTFYKGRCSCLRRIGFKTIRLRSHRKNVRPFKFYSLKWELSDSNAAGSPAESRENLSLKHKTKLCQTHKKHFFRFLKRKKILSGIKNKASQKDALSLKNLSHLKNKTSQDNFFGKKNLHKKRKKLKLKKKEHDESSKKKTKPSKKAIKKLKAAKMENSTLEPCTCRDGKNLTVIIKGICSSSKNELNKTEAKNVSGEYSKTTDEDVETEKRLLCQLKDSLEVHQKQIQQKKICSDDKSELNKTETKNVCGEYSKTTDEDLEAKEMLLCQLKDSLEVHQKQIQQKKICSYDKSELNKTETKNVCGEYSKTTDEDLEAKEMLLCQLKDSLEVHQKQIKQKKICSDDKSELNKTETKNVCGEYSKTTDEDLEAKEMLLCQLKDSLEVHQKQIQQKKIYQEKDEDNHPKVKSELNRRFCEEKLDDTEKKEMKEVNKKESLVTLYKNPENSKSSLALTKEELIKMGRCCEETFIVKF